METLVALLAAAGAAGLSLYAAIAVPALAAYLGLVTLPAPLAGFAAPPVWSSLLALLLVETLAARHRFTDLLWNVLHTVVRPLGALLLVSTAGGLTWAAAVTGALLALALHLGGLSLRLAAWTGAPVPGPRLLSAIQPALAAGIATAAFISPTAALGLTGALLLAILVRARHVRDAALTAIRSPIALLTRAGRPDRRTWDSRLPAASRRAVEDHLGRELTRPRSAPVTLQRLEGRWPFYRGRLVVAAASTALFVHGRLRTRVLRLNPGRGRVDAGVLLERIDITDGAEYSLLVGPDAPRGPAILAELGEATGRMEHAAPPEV